jgi:hypothetical protein
MFTKTFFHFLFGFVALISLAFGVLVGLKVWGNFQNVDNTAAPR